MAGGPTVAFVGGGTAGHLVPGLAIREELARRRTDVSSFFLVARSSPGQWVFEKAGVGLEHFEAHPYVGRSTLDRLALPGRVLSAALQCRRILKRRSACLLVVLGGYGSVDAALAAASLGLPILVHESNARAGLSNRLAGRLATRVCLGLPAARGDFPADVAVETGTPVLAEFAEAARRRAARSRCDATRRILVLGGSLGSPFLDVAVPPLLGRVAASGLDLEVMHVTGDSAGVGRRYGALGLRATTTVRLVDVSGELARADFVISRAGAMAIAEIAAVGAPCLFVPLPAHAWDHQVANLRACEAGCSPEGGPWWTAEDSWDEAAVALRIGELLRDDEALAAAASRLKELARPDAAARVADACESLLKADSRTS